MGDYNKTTGQLHGEKITSWNTFAGYNYSNLSNNASSSAIFGGSVSIPLNKDYYSDNITLFGSQVTGSIGDQTGISTTLNLTNWRDLNYELQWGITGEVGAGYTNYTNGGQETRVNAGGGLGIAKPGPDYVDGGYGTSKSLLLTGGIQARFTGNKKEISPYVKLDGALNFNNITVGAELTADKRGLEEVTTKISYNF